MFTIRKARIDDCGLINQMAGEVFPATYQEISYLPDNWTI